MADGFEAYLKLSSHQNRRQARKMLRDVEAEGMKFEVAADSHRLDEMFAEMIELHRQRWAAVGKPGSFAPRHTECHKQTSALLLGGGGAVIGRLTHVGQTLAVVFGYRVREQLHCYQQGVALGIGRVRSPGTAAWLLLMRHQADRGVTLFDHLRGVTAFKERFATGQKPLSEIRVTRVGLRTCLARITDGANRFARRIARPIHRSVKPRVPTRTHIASPASAAAAPSQPA
jgi:CelD/BcsL family acetyltransferase involved in cellulose biosynthesis